MSSFKTQRLANHFPVHTRIRKDPSSLGQRMLSVFAEYFDFAEADLMRAQQESWLLKWYMGLDSVYRIQLVEGDFMTLTPTVGGGYNATYPSVVSGTHASLGALTLTQVENFESLLFGVPERLEEIGTETLNNLTVWQTGDSAITAMDIQERLHINVEGSVVYKLKGPVTDRMFSGIHAIHLEGLDINRQPVRETVLVPDDGVYLTKEIYSELNELPLADGFNGTVTVGLKQADFPFVQDPYRIGALIDFEGPLKMRLDTESGSDTNLIYFISRFKRGDEYRRGDVPIMENDEELGPQRLYDESSSDYVAVDLAVSPQNTYLYVIDDSGFLHVYDHCLTPFGPPPNYVKTPSIRMSLIPLCFYVALDATHSMWTRFDRPRSRVEKVIISRTQPNDTVEYLQANLTWAGSSYEFLGNIPAVTSADSWTDIRFDITYDQVGQWDFTVQAFFSDGEVNIDQTSVMVDSLDALVSIDTGVSSPTGIFFSEDGNIVITDGSDFTTFSEHRDVYFAEAQNQVLYLREPYTSVSVTA